MNNRREIAHDVAQIMPKIARSVVFDFFPKVELPPAQVFALMALKEKGICNFSALRQELHISAPTVTGIIDRLERVGYVKRVADTKDRRSINIHMTAKGNRFINKLRMIIESRWCAILEKLTVDECKEYVRILRKIKSSI